MKKSKKYICLVLTLIMVMCCTSSACAAHKEAKSMDTLSWSDQEHFGDQFKNYLGWLKNAAKSTEVTLEKNNKGSDWRHIKISWEKVENATDYEIQIADNKYFKDAVTKKRLSVRGLYWNFAELPGEGKLDGTYYIRVRPCFTYKVTDEDYMRVFGRWSNVVIAKWSD